MIAIKAVIIYTHIIGYEMAAFSLSIFLLNSNFIYEFSKNSKKSEYKSKKKEEIIMKTIHYKHCKAHFDLILKQSKLRVCV